MSMDGKRDRISRADILAVSRVAGLARGRGEAILEQVPATVTDWAAFAARASVDDRTAVQVGNAHRRLDKQVLG